MKKCSDLAGNANNATSKNERTDVKRAEPDACEAAIVCDVCCGCRGSRGGTGKSCTSACLVDPTKTEGFPPVFWGVIPMVMLCRFSVATGSACRTEMAMKPDLRPGWSRCNAVGEGCGWRWLISSVNQIRPSARTWNLRRSPEPHVTLSHFFSKRHHDFHILPPVCQFERCSMCRKTATISRATLRNVSH